MTTTQKPRRDILANEIRQRLANGDLYSIEEVRIALQFVSNRIAEDAKVDFDKIFFLNQLLYDSSPEPYIVDPAKSPVEMATPDDYQKYMQKALSGLTIQMEAKPTHLKSQNRKDTMVDNLDARLRDLTISLHVAVLKIIAMEKLHKLERQKVIKQLIVELEKAGVDTEKALAQL